MSQDPAPTAMNRWSAVTLLGGVGLDELNGRAYARQWGDNPGFKNFFFADPQGEKGMVVFTNGDRGARVYERVIRAVTGDDHPAFLFG